jgi:biotin carboxylase
VLVGDRGQLDGVLETLRARRGGGSRTFLMESLMTGEEWTCDGIVYDGEILFLTLGRYAAPCLAVVSQRLPYHLFKFSPDVMPEAFEKARPLAERALAALGLERGIFHMELFRSPQTGEFAFGECGARRGGALTHEQALQQFGFDITAAAVDCALGLRPRIPEPRVRSGVSGSAFLPMVGGLLVSCPDARALAARPHVEYARIEAPPGTWMPQSLTDVYAQRLGQIMVFGPDQPTAARYLDEATAWFLDRVETVPEGASGRELRERGGKAGFCFDAYEDEA